ncbi:MAG: hypothetical protein FWF92_04175 [Oscillospiraceae bacterium]|nr:hypothetical protein [Oscillospiraceae bacterium]
MGFGLLLLGYITVLGVLPESFIYYSYGIYIAITGGIIMLMGFCKLEEFNVYFKFMKYVTIIYILILLGFSPFLIINFSEEFFIKFIIVSKIIRISFLFVFHFYLLSGILALSKEINNIIIEKKAKRNIFITYIFFASFIFELFNMPVIAPFMTILGLIYFVIIISILYSCYMRITYKGHDEAIEAKYKIKKVNSKKKR